MKQGVLVTQIRIRHFTFFILDSEVHRIFLGFVAVKKKKEEGEEEGVAPCCDVS